MDRHKTRLLHPCRLFGVDFGGEGPSTPAVYSIEARRETSEEKLCECVRVENALDRARSQMQRDGSRARIIRYNIPDEAQ